jgi:hypothetical protein
MEIELKETRRVVQKGGRAQARERKAAVEKQQTTLLQIAVECLRIGLGKKAAVHLYNAKLFTHAASLFKATSNWDNAARCYEKLEDTESAVDCLTQLNLPKAVEKAIQMLKSIRKYDRALKLAVEHNLGGKLEEIARLCAKTHHRNGNVVPMQAALDHLPLLQQKQFLLETEQLERAVASFVESNTLLYSISMFCAKLGRELAPSVFALFETSFAQFTTPLVLANSAFPCEVGTECFSSDGIVLATTPAPSVCPFPDCISAVYISSRRGSNTDIFIYVNRVSYIRVNAACACRVVALSASVLRLYFHLW